MSSRLELHEELCSIVNMRESDGDRHTYFNAPQGNKKMKYPAIRYSVKKKDKRHANDAVYQLTTCYEVTVIDTMPDSEISEKVLMLPYCEYDRSYIADNLHHDVYTLYY